MSENSQIQIFQCEHCPKSYTSEESLEGHVQANHWKLLRPKKRGKPSKKVIRNV